MPTSTTHLLSPITLPIAVKPATLLVAHRIASIERTTTLIAVAEGRNLSRHEKLRLEADRVSRYHDNRDYDSDGDSRYHRRRSTRYD